MTFGEKFFLTKVLKNGSFSLTQHENRPFFPVQKQYFLQQSIVLLFVVKSWLFGGLTMVGSDKKNLENRDSKIGWKPSNSRHSGKNSLTFPWLFRKFKKVPWLFHVFPWLFLKTAPFPGFPWPLGTLSTQNYLFNEVLSLRLTSFFSHFLISAALRF